MRYGVVTMAYVMMHVMIAVVDMMSRTKRAVMVMMMESVAVMPVPVMCPAVVRVPPTRVITPVPRTMPCVPCVAPKPVVDNRTVDINRFDDIVRTIYVLVTYHLNAYFVLLVFLYIDRGHVLIDIFGENSLQYDQTLVSFACLYYA